MGSLSGMSVEQPRSRVVTPAVAATLTLVAVGCHQIKSQIAKGVQQLSCH
jgi:hypothetical protein